MFKLNTAEKLQKNNQSSNHQASASTVSSGKESALEIGKILAEVDSEDDEIEAVCDDNLMADESMDISDDQTETPAEFNESAGTFRFLYKTLVHSFMLF